MLCLRDAVNPFKKTQPAVYILNFKTREPTGSYATATTALTACITTQLETLLQSKMSHCTSHQHHNHLLVPCS